MNRHERRADEVQRKAAIARANAQLKTQMSDAYDKLDQVIDAEVDKVRAETTISCTKGCAFCCDQVITGTLIEAEYIVARYPALAHAAAPELRRQEARMSELGLADMGLGLQGPEAERRQHFLDRWYAQRVPCAFLDPATKECRIYDARPYACRAHFAITQPASICDARPDPDKPNGYDVPMMSALDTSPIAESEASGRFAEVYIARHGRERLIMSVLPVLVLAVLEGGK